MIATKQGEAPNSELYPIHNSNKSQVIEDIKSKYKRYFIKNSSTYQKIHEIVIFLAQGLYNGTLLSDIFESVRRDFLCLCNLKKYIQDVDEIICDGYSDQDGTIQLVNPEEINSNDQKWMENQQQLESQYQKSVKNLAQDISLYSDEMFSIQKQSPKIHPFSFPASIKPLEIVRALQMTVLPMINYAFLPSNKPLNVSQVSTNSSNSKNKSCVLNQKPKQLLIKVQAPKAQNFDYKKQYEKKLHNTLVRSSIISYKIGKKSKA